MPAKLNLIGHVFGRLTVIAPAPPKVSGSTSFTQWHCRCLCGAALTTYTNGLRSGHTRSCGCLQKEAVATASRKYAPGAVYLYATWMEMIRRCTVPTHRVYRHYGGRGIKVCERWSSSFAAFVEDMGHRPPRTTLDRRDNDGHYEPANCRWAAHATQHRNKRTNVRFTFDGRTQVLEDWAREFATSSTNMRRRFEKFGSPYPQRASRRTPKEMS